VERGLFSTQVLFKDCPVETIMRVAVRESVPTERIGNVIPENRGTSIKTVAQRKDEK
jgi:hypothetical protein